jgi:phosphoglycolate phosphatase
MTKAFRQSGLPEPGAGDVRRQVGLNLERAISRLLPGEAKEGVAQVASSYRSIAREWRVSGAIDEPLFPGIRELIEALEAPHHFLAVATGKALVGLQHTLEIHALSERFHSLQTSDKCLGKPDPDMVLKAMHETAAVPENTIVIGDTTFDMEMARAAGATAIGVAWGYHDPADLTKAGAHHVIDQPLDLLLRLESP